jgi:DNA-binding NarL/FixJ family response regulator
MTPDTEADTTPDNVTVTTPDTKRTPTRTRRGSSTADQVTAMRKKHPGWTAVEIAERLGVSDRTVRRHLSPKPDAPQANAA